MLYSGPNSTSAPVRVHGAFVRDQEVHAVVQAGKRVVVRNMSMALRLTAKVKVAQAEVLTVVKIWIRYLIRPLTS